MTFPFVDREPVRPPTLPGHDDELWDTLIELSEVRPGEWTLIGEQLMFLHGIEHGATPPRISADLDVLGNARIAGLPIAAFAAGCKDLPPQWLNDATGNRCCRVGASASDPRRSSLRSAW